MPFSFHMNILFIQKWHIDTLSFHFLIKFPAAKLRRIYPEPFNSLTIPSINLQFFLHNCLIFLHNLIIQSLSELLCYRISNILIDIFSIIIKTSCLVIWHRDKDVSFLGDADSDSGHFEYIVEGDGCVSLYAALLILHGSYGYFDIHISCIDCICCIYSVVCVGHIVCSPFCLPLLALMDSCFYE